MTKQTELSLEQLTSPASPVDAHTGGKGFTMRADAPEALRGLYDARRRDPEWFADKPNPLGIDVSKPFERCLPGE